MKERVLVQFEPEQLERLRALSAERGVSLSALIREATDALLAEQDRRARWERAMAAVGTFRRLDRPRRGKEHDESFADAVLEEIDRQGRERR